MQTDKELLPSVFSSDNDWSIQILYRYPKGECQVPRVIPSAVYSLNLVLNHVKPWKPLAFIWVLQPISNYQNATLNKTI